MVLSDQIVETMVIEVQWSPSKDGYLKPWVRIEPIELNGVTIEYATGFNGSFIEQNKIGIGSVIQIIRSGDVIPHIMKVIWGFNLVKSHPIKTPLNCCDSKITCQTLPTDVFRHF